MTLEQIQDLVRAGESEVLEFKRTTAETETAARTVCAMLNHRGGRLLFGVTPGPNGSVLGQEVGDQTIETVAQRLRSIEPPAFPSVDRVPVRRGREVIVVSVSSGRNPPYTYAGQAYRRVGNTNERLSQAAYNSLLLENLHREQRWENQPVADWAVTDLDEREIRLVVEEAIRRGRLDEPSTRDPTDLLRGLGVLKNGLLLRAAAVLFGNSERLSMEFPQCTLRIARFKGTSRTEFIDNRQVYGNAFKLLSSAEAFVRDNNPIASRVVPNKMERIDEPLYPPLAVREALANALCHREYAIAGGSVAVGVYDDRLEVTSSGTLHFGFTPESLFEPHESLPWNPLIARVFYRRGSIEAWGRGTLRMAEIAAESHLPPPEIEDAGGCVTVRFRPRRYIPPGRVQRDITERQQAILRTLDEAPEGLPVREIAARFADKATIRQVRWDLGVLKVLDLVDSSGRGRGARWRRC